jgi:hypothetical protein
MSGGPIISTEKVTSKLKRAILQQLSVEYDNLPPDLQQRADNISTRATRYFQKAKTRVKEDSPKGRRAFKGYLIGGTTSITQFIDTELVPRRKHTTTPDRQRKKKVVGI